MKERKTIRFKDPAHDDFAKTSIHTKHVGRDFPYVHASRLWNAGAFLLYYLVGIPIVFVVSKTFLGLKFENRRVLRPLRKQGFFLYGNHTRYLDAFVPAMAAFPKRAHVIANPDAVSLPMLKNVVLMFGCIPIPSEFTGMPEFLRAVSLRCRQKRCIGIFPEAHIWPFYTGVRAFSDVSFRYPVTENAPVVAMATTYRRRRGLFRILRKPGMTVTFSDPFFPSEGLPTREAQTELRDKVYDFMKQRTSQPDNVEYIHYESAG